MKTKYRLAIESDITTIVTLVNEAYKVEGKWKKDPLRVTKEVLESHFQSPVDDLYHIVLVADNINDFIDYNLNSHALSTGILGHVEYVIYKNQLV